MAGQSLGRIAGVPLNIFISTCGRGGRGGAESRAGSGGTGGGGEAVSTRTGILASRRAESNPNMFKSRNSFRT